MDDISEKLADLLNDPESLKRVREMAENILGGEQDNTPPPANNNGGIFDNIDIDPIQLSKILSVMAHLKSDKDDKRARLLLALKPHLSEPRREKVDTAIKLLKLIDLLPFLKDSGMLNF